MPLSAERWMHLNDGIVHLKEKPLNQQAQAFIRILKEMQNALDSQEVDLDNRFIKR